MRMHRLFGVWALALISTSVLADDKGATPSYADPKWTYSLGYVVSIPTASFSDFIGNVSFRGLALEFDGRAAERLRWGLSFRWLYFNENTDNATTTTGSGATITGNNFKGVDALPILAHAKYVFPMERMQPYVALGVGTIYAARLSAIGTFQFNSYGWQFDLAPEVGVRFQPGGPSTGIQFSSRYDAGFGSDASPAISAISFLLGIYVAM